MGKIWHEESLGCKSSWDLVSHMWKWTILSKSQLGDSFEVYMNGFEKVCFHLEDYDNPHNMKMECISNVFFAQQIALDHAVEERDMTFHDNDKVGLEGDARDSVLWGFVAALVVRGHYCLCGKG